MIPHHWHPLVHEQISIYKCKHKIYDSKGPEKPSWLIHVYRNHIPNHLYCIFIVNSKTTINLSTTHLSDNLKCCLVTTKGLILRNVISTTSIVPIKGMHCLSLAMRTYMVWHYKFSRICSCTGREFKRSVDTLIGEQPHSVYCIANT